MMVDNKITEEERILATLAHAGIIANVFNLIGIIGAILIWATQRNRSPYVADHALHALVFQGIGLLITMLLGLVWGGCLFVSLLPSFLRPELYHTDIPLFSWIVLCFGLVILTMVLAGIIYGLMGAWEAWHGHRFHYGLIGRIITAASESSRPASIPDGHEPPSQQEERPPEEQESLPEKQS